VTQDALSSDLGKGLSFVPSYQALSAWDAAERPGDRARFDARTRLAASPQRSARD
jgi:hypothetical protein